MGYEQRVIDAYYAQHQPCPSCHAEWDMSDPRGWVVTHYRGCGFIDEPPSTINEILA